MDARDDGEDVGVEEGFDDMGFFGSVLYFITNIAITIYVLIDHGFNRDIYSTSYTFGMILFIGLNGLVLIGFAFPVTERSPGWPYYIGTAMAFIPMLWMFHGLGQPWRTFLIAGIGYAGLFLIGLSWLRRPKDEPL